ncbi:hypothetical protein [Vannielia litorea]|nr:hypothetical protein [Vannielia litorea]
MSLPAHPRHEAWISHVFPARGVERGAVVRRSEAWVEHEIGHERFVAEVR